jgi:DNA-nicking Smr family endonuclease
VKATDSQINMKSMESKTKIIIPEEDNTKAREELIAKDKKDSQIYDLMTDELIKSMEILKEVDRLHQESGISEQFKKIKYVEREEDMELKEAYEREQEKFNAFSETLKGKVDGEISIDLHGNIAKEGIKGTGTYVMRNGKLVEGKGQ